MNFRKNEDGGITLEAAIFMPFFILFLIFLIFMIKFAITDIALNRAVSETAKQIATQAYPVHKVIKLGEAGAISYLEGKPHYQDMVEDLSNNRDAIVDELKEALGEDGYQTLISDPINQGVSYVLDTAAIAFLTPIVQLYLEDAHDLGFIDKEKVEVVTPVLFPNLVSDGGNKYVLITAEYDIVLPIPFIEQTYTIRKQAYERAWLGS
ncbi:TadE/TadG family type IV pilus assembly protein [Bacillus alkalicellulosilyticus]|uniref:TadE/TadG family type IV pilus assembly protein n=1 Tax=Alkalihalobacterium alkalicellulosilyticum TaxID=1912214 RepID=UPI000996AB04|nr:TadE/TadG family type IV pilus assembly protein [Bacillus alkalicellulosilyticus]